MFQQHMDRRSQMGGAYPDLVRSVEEISTTTRKIYLELVDQVDFVLQRIRTLAAQEDGPQPIPWEDDSVDEPTLPEGTDMPK
jgi:hypothetical protein